jgi:sugar lactone lactonase YvrE/thiol-disulfide isomerase/thioredoxin
MISGGHGKGTRSYRAGGSSAGAAGAVRRRSGPARIRRGPWWLALALLLLLSGSSQAQVGAARAVPAPEFPAGLDWINSDRPLRLADLRGKIVLLDFLTFGCINCIHVLPDLHALEDKYADELLVIGVHSAKFDHERGSENIRRFAERYEIEHPIVNDSEFEIWRAYRVYAWPSFILIDPEGRIVGGHAGEGIFDIFDRAIGRLVTTFEERGTLDRRPLDLAGDGGPRPDSPLRFPGKVLADEEGDRLFIADTSHHRIVVTTLHGEVLRVIGSGQPGFEDGPPDEASFRRPQGLALAGPDVLYVADTGNHSLRRVDLTGAVATAAGTGEQEYMFDFREATASGTGLNSPWDLLFHDGQLYIAMAGQHQIWRYDPATELLHLHAGSGREALQDGALIGAGLNQPSGLATDGTDLFVADSEASAVRRVAFDPGGPVATLVGMGLFEFGDVDGRGDRVRLQHPKGVEFHDGLIYIADTYNNKVKVLDPETREVRTLFGSGEPGWRDGRDALLYEPGGLSVADGRLFLADTNNHAIRTADLSTGEVRTLLLDDEAGLLAAAESSEFFGTTLAREPQRVAPGPGRLELRISLPESYKVNDLAPLGVAWHSDGEAVTVDPSFLRTAIHEPRYPLDLEVPAFFTLGQATVTAELDIYYCREGAEALCLVDRVRLSVPVTVAEGGGAAVDFSRRPPPVPGAGG